MAEPLHLRRLDNWEYRFARFIEQRRLMPFAWRINDCVTFSVDAVEAITGKRLLEPTWSSKDEALRMLADIGGPEAAVTSVLGRGGQNYAEARQGDVVLAEQGSWLVTMICVGAFLAAPGMERLEFKPLRAGRLVWRVG